MRRRSNQRITKIKKDFIEELLKRAEAMDVADATIIQPPGSDLTPYPDMNNLRLWTRDYLLKGLTKVYPVKLASDGQTYLTTLIDGLPLFTKMSKTIGVQDQLVLVPDRLSSFITTVGNPNIDSNFNVSGFSASNYLTIPNSELYVNPLNKWTLCFIMPPTAGSGAMPTMFLCDSGFALLYYPPDTGLNYYNYQNDNCNWFYTPGFNQKVWVQMWHTQNSGNTYNLHIATSTDGKNYTEHVNTLNNARTTTNYLIYLGIDARPQVTNKIAFQGTIVLSECKIEHPDGTISEFLHYTEQPAITSKETSKPGLWLSNLIAPVSNSLAGSWLRHNLIHDNESSYNAVNSDVIGNYTWSFFQRGIIHRTAGSSHNNEDSYCQHWSPSALGCISHDAIIIPTNNLRSTYTSYQTPVVPADANMQRYEETTSKDVEFTFVDNNNNEPLTTTQFNGRVVGKDWSYELIFHPNNSGSACNYGEDPECSNDRENSSNGGCVIGTITYQDSITGTTCTQEVNSCFQTNQSFFNPLVPDLQGTEPLEESDKPQIHQDLHYALYGGGISWFNLSGHNPPPKGRGTLKIVNSGQRECINNTVEYIYNGTTSTNSIIIENFNMYNYDGGNCGWNINGISLGYPNATDCGYCTCYTGCRAGQHTVTFAPYNVKEPETGVDIYFNIIDLKKQYESEGLPWSGGCGNARFSSYFSTEPCKKSYCTPKLIAKNVDINSLGDITLLKEINL